MALQPGDRLDRFTLVKLLGQGGQGAVWNATDALDPSQSRALKLLKVAGAKPVQIERIRREAHALAALSHPSLVSVHLLFEDLREGIMCVVMDFVDGMSLAEAAEDRRLTPERCEHVLAHILQAIAYVHAQRVAHRDLKMENVILARDFWDHPEHAGNVKVVDFGIAIQTTSEKRLTDVGMVIGTAPYLAPEIIHPSYWGDQTPATARDVFAFAVLGWYLLAGAHPTGLPEGATLADYAQAYAAQGQRPFVLAGYQGAWANVLQQCAQVDPRQRPEDGGKVWAILHHGLTTIPDSGPAPTVPEKPVHTAPGAPPAFTVPQGPAPVVQARATRATSRSGLLLAGGLVVAGVIATVAGLALVALSPDSSQSPAPASSPASQPRTTAASSTRPAPAPGVQGQTTRCEAGFDDCDDNASNGCETDLQITSRHCGRCSHDCLGGGCKEGRCQPEILASGQGFPVGINASPTHVFWVNMESPMGSGPYVFRKALKGGAPEPLFTDVALRKPQSMVTDGDGNLYVSSRDGDSIARRAHSGGMSSQFVTNESDPTRLAIDRRSLYWTSNEEGRVRTTALSGGPVRTLAEDGNHPARLVLDDAYVYWTSRGDDRSATGKVSRVRKDGEERLAIGTGLPLPLAIDVDAEYVYWTNEGLGARGGSLMRATKDGRKVEVLASHLDHPTGLEVKGPVLFWVSGPQDGPGEVWQKPVSGGDAMLLASGQEHPFVIVATDSAVYWANTGKSNKSNGSIMRLVR